MFLSLKNFTPPPIEKPGFFKVAFSLGGVVGLEIKAGEDESVCFAAPRFDQIHQWSLRRIEIVLL